VDRCPDDSLSECSSDTLSALRSNNVVELDDESGISLPVNFVCQVHTICCSSSFNFHSYVWRYAIVSCMPETTMTIVTLLVTVIIKLQFTNVRSLCDGNVFLFVTSTKEEVNAFARVCLSVC